MVQRTTLCLYSASPVQARAAPTNCIALHTHCKSGCLIRFGPDFGLELRLGSLRTADLSWDALNRLLMGTGQLLCREATAGGEWARLLGRLA